MIGGMGVLTMAEAMKAVGYPTQHRTAPPSQIKNYLAPHINSAEVEKSCSKEIILLESKMDP